MLRHCAVPLAACLLPLAIAGCIAGKDANIYGSPFGQRVVGNQNSVIVSNVVNEMDAFPIAEQHCKKFGRSARFKSEGGYKAAFDCI